MGVEGSNPFCSTTFFRSPRLIPRQIASPAAPTDIEEAAYRRLTEVLATANDRFEHADSMGRARIVQLVNELAPVISNFFELRDFESLRYALLDLERNLQCEAL